MLKVGLIGVGGISGAHIPAWEAIPEVSLVALCDIRPERMEPYPDKHHYVDFEDMLAHEQLDILDICLPTYLHADHSIRAIEHGIHVLCEKPISLKKEDVDRIYTAAAQNHVCFMVAQVLRFWPEYELLKKIYDEQTYGRLLSGYMGRLSNCPEWSWDNWLRDQERSGLVPFDLHIHDLDFMIYAFGTPQLKTAHRSQLPNADHITAVYEYPDFYIMTEAAWYDAPFPFRADFRFEFENALVCLDMGKFIVYENSGRILDLSTNSEQDTGSIQLPKSNAYANEIRYFADCVLTGRFPDKIKADELKTVIELCDRL